MNRISVMGVSIWLICATCEAQASKTQAPTAAPTKKSQPTAAGSVQVSRGKSEMDGKRWTVLTVSAQASYRGWISIIRPDLNVVCNETNGKNVVFLDLEPGPLNAQRGVEDMITVTRVKLDAHDAVAWEWEPRSDDHQKYDLYDLSSITDILDAKTMLLEFSPFMQSGKIVARFDVSGLRKAFDKYPECRLEEPLSIHPEISPGQVGNSSQTVVGATSSSLDPDRFPSPTDLPRMDAASTARTYPSLTAAQIEPKQSPTLPSASSAVLINGPAAIYPPIARQARIQGTVQFKAIVGKDGTLQNLQLVSGHPLLAAAALEAAKTWTYQPAMLDGKPQESTIKISVPFQFHDGKGKE